MVEGACARFQEGILLGEQITAEEVACLKIADHAFNLEHARLVLLRLDSRSRQNCSAGQIVAARAKGRQPARVQFLSDVQRSFLAGE